MLSPERLAIIDTAVEQVTAAHRLLGEAAAALTAAYDRLHAEFVGHNTSGRIQATGSLCNADHHADRAVSNAAHALYCLAQFRAED